MGMYSGQLAQLTTPACVGCTVGDPAAVAVAVAPAEADAVAPVVAVGLAPAVAVALAPTVAVALAPTVALAVWVPAGVEVAPEPGLWAAIPHAPTTAMVTTMTMSSRQPTGSRPVRGMRLLL